ncbi:class I SAM-dependent methyltransferase [Jiulongibacter sp. NS-SX5]|uniref:class I SAM-dependent methyltransferase n=1 Tax=Jiulongibacter sp. NS-SX5 TaxID=3463854 RepID=UPI0040580452
MQLDIYNEQFVAGLFNRMSQTYGLTNYLSSFGFTERWRRQCVKEIDWSQNIKQGYDFMSGMGESWPNIEKELKSEHKITGVDLSPVMNATAVRKSKLYKRMTIEIEEQNILENRLSSESADYIISTFGLKTFSSDQLKILAKQINRILKKGGQFSMIEISKPKNRLLQLPYIFYLKYLIPLIGKLFMGNSADYRMLGVYCTNFGDCTEFSEFLKEEGLRVKMKSYFFGCATGVVGHK